nr:glycoside hydrolase family 71/99-like protein [uncultured Carboxylicivirga sp.]
MRIMNMFLYAICMLLMACSDDNGSSQTDTGHVEKYDPVQVNKSNTTDLYMHYMTWFETKESSDNNSWGVHWTMANQNPDNITNDKREIASHFYPLIGPYHSGDKDVIEYHLLLMKYAGIDGLLFDWYGTYDVNDYSSINKNTQVVINLLDEVGLKYAFVYEDRTLPEVVNAGMAANNENAAKNDMRYLQSNYFTKDDYIQINSNPLLMVFGPITLESPESWTNVFSVLSQKPTFLTLWNESSDAGENADGEYAWVYQDNEHLNDFYQNRSQSLSIAMGAAYPGFVDFYNEGGWGNEIGWTIDHQDGAVLDETLQLAASTNVDYLQLVTWNDFGEGTMFEPTNEFGYTFIDKLKSFAGVSGQTSVFENIHQLYEYRKQYKSNSFIQTQLDQAFYYFVSLQVDKAIEILDIISEN